jgi:hypothetical protein
LSIANGRRLIQTHNRVNGILWRIMRGVGAAAKSKDGVAKALRVPEMVFGMMIVVRSLCVKSQIARKRSPNVETFQ